MFCHIVCVSLVMPWISLFLAFAATAALSYFACAGYHADETNKNETHDYKKLSVEDVAKTADFIVNGYAFTSETDKIRVLNLNNMDKAMVLDITGEVLMTSMDDIEISIVKEYLERNKEFLKYNIS